MTVASRKVLTNGCFILDIYYGCIEHSQVGITSNSRTRMIVAYNLFIQAVVSRGNGGGRQEIARPFCVTSPYHISCSPCETHWCFWFGRPTVYQSLPRLRSESRRPSVAFTNTYHRIEGDGGLGIDLGQDQTNRMGRTVKGVVVRWCGSMVMVM